MKPLIPPSERDRAKANIVTCACAAVFLAIVLYISGISAYIGKIFLILGPFLVGGIFAFILLPISRRLEGLMKSMMKKASPRLIRGLSTLICMVFLIAMLTGFLVILLPQVVTSVKSLVGLVTEFVNNNEATINDFLIKNGLFTEGSELNSFWDNLVSTLTQYINVFLPNLLTISNTVYQFIFHLFVGLIIGCHFLLDRDSMACRSKRACYAFMEKKNAEALIFWTRQGNRLFGGFLSGKIVDSLIVGVICYIFMLIAGMHYSVLISVIIGVTNILPFFGPFIGAIPSIFILLMVEPMHALIFGIFILILQQIDGNLIGPKILGDHVGITALWTMFAIILGSGLFGFMGILLSVPVFALLYSMTNAAIEINLRKKKMPVTTDEYADMPRTDIMPS